MMDRPCRVVECKTRVNLDLFCRSRANCAHFAPYFPLCSAFQTSRRFVIIKEASPSKSLPSATRVSRSSILELEGNERTTSIKEEHALGRMANSERTRAVVRSFEEFRNVTRIRSGSRHGSQIFGRMAWSDRGKPQARFGFP